MIREKSTLGSRNRISGNQEFKIKTKTDKNKNTYGDIHTRYMERNESYKERDNECMVRKRNVDYLHCWRGC